MIPDPNAMPMPEQGPSPAPAMPVQMPMATPGFEDDLSMPGASKEIDAEAHAATKDLKLNRGFRVVSEDAQGGSTTDEPSGNR